MVLYGQKALVVDDEEHVRELLSLALGPLGFESIRQASNGQEAIDMFEEDQPDLMLLDINMPIKTGEEVLRSIRNKSKGTCIIVLTLLSDEECVKKYINLGCEYFIVKDVPLPQIIQLIEEKWGIFKKKKNEKLFKKYNLNEMLKEIEEDEKMAANLI